ncbi:MAG: hypothetical protein AAB654_11150 [Acidobacteriota bacterium]
MPRKRKAARKCYKDPPPDILEMAVAGGASAWNEDELRAYERYAQEFPDAAAGARVWEQFKREHEDYTLGLADAEAIAILENPNANITEGRTLAFFEWLAKYPDGDRLARVWYLQRHGEAPR